MVDPSSRTSRQALASGLGIALVVAVGGFLLGRESASAPPVVVAAPPVIVAVPEPIEPSILGRSDLIALAAAAADAIASGNRLPDDLKAADGRRFDMRLAFGCNGPAPADSTAPMRWRYDAEKSVLRVQAAPIGWQPADFLGIPLPETVAGIEAYWIPRPWTRSEACPPAAAQTIIAANTPFPLPLALPQPPAPPEQSLMLVQFFTAEAGRQAARADRPFTVTQRMSELPASFANGLRLRLRGRLAGNAGGGPVYCSQPGGPQQRPICAVSVTLDQVAIEDAEGAVLGNWDVGQPVRRAS
ncbi:hypothetical protein [Sandarakinorhabdus sp.]|uniref:hypothetical protein n=1 Tax=Sandarakinorhabdus sp. TaxID=1916663 RepID=UPI003F70B9CC